MDFSLFDLRKEAHEAFDPLWKTGQRSREGAYEVLQDILKLPTEKAHISMLDRNQCLLLIERLETGNYWIGAGKKLCNKRKVWQRGKREDVYKTRHKINKKIRQLLSKFKIHKKTPLPGC